MTDTTPYQESEDHVPNPLHQTGVVDTTGTSGDLGGRIQNISPIFAQAKAEALANAVEAIDDPNRNESEVVAFHDDEDEPDSREEAEEKLRAAAEEAANDPQLSDPGQTPAAREAAQEGGDSGDGQAEAPSLPADSATKGEWIQHAEDHGYDVDQSLTKDDYVAAVKEQANQSGS